MSAEYFLGVDGGGSKTTVRISKAVGKELLLLNESVGGPCNPNRIPFERAIENLGLAIESAVGTSIESVTGALAELPSSSDSIQADKISACLAIAGAGDSAVAKRFQDWAQQRFCFAKLIVTTDVKAAFASGCPSGTGIVLISGTGSIAYGESDSASLGQIPNLNGPQIARSGGLLGSDGDPGSGYWIGKRFQDYCVQKNVSLREIAGEEFENLTDPAEIAKLAEVVLELTRKSIQMENPLALQSAARKIAQKASRELAGLVCSVAEELQFYGEKSEFAMAGSLLLKNELIRDWLIEIIRDKPRFRNFDFSKIRYVESPVDGALQMAYDSWYG